MVRFEKYKELVVAVLILLLSVIMFSLSFTVKRETMSTIGPGFMPRLVSSGIFLLGLIHLKTVWSQIGEHEDAKPRIVQEETDGRNMLGWIKGSLDWLSAVLILLYVFLLGSLGFILSSAIYMFLQMSVLSVGEKRNYLKMSILSVLVPILVYVLFTNYFYLMLPAGILG